MHHQYTDSSVKVPTCSDLGTGVQVATGATKFMYVHMYVTCKHHYAPRIYWRTGKSLGTGVQIETGATKFMYV